MCVCDRWYKLQISTRVVRIVSTTRKRSATGWQMLNVRVRRWLRRRILEEANYHVNNRNDTWNYCGEAALDGRKKVSLACAIAKMNLTSRLYTSLDLLIANPITESRHENCEICWIPFRKMDFNLHTATVKREFLYPIESLSVFLCAFRKNKYLLPSSKVISASNRYLET